MPSATEPKQAEALRALRDLHQEIDQEASLIANKHAERLRCGRGCSACCLDDLTVTPVEAARIRASHPELLAEGAPHAVGACAFLAADQSCRIYADRPSVCRSQGLPLRVFFEDEAEEIVEHRDICPLNEEGGPPLSELAESDCWLVGPFEIRLSQIDADYSGASDLDAEARVALRGLFAQSSR